LRLSPVRVWPFVVLNRLEQTNGWNVSPGR
jgi:hypothetical protein